MTSACTTGMLIDCSLSLHCVHSIIIPSTTKNVKAAKKPYLMKQTAASPRNAAPMRTGEPKEIVAQKKISTAKKISTSTAPTKSF